MRTKKTTFVMCVLGVVATGLAQDHLWTTKSPLPVATSLHSASVLDGQIYIIGGTDTIYRVATAYYATVRMYDPATDTWTQKADLSRGRGRSASAVVDGKIYALGGSPHGDSDFAIVEMYDPDTDTWTRKADLPRARCFLTASVVNSRIYVIGGKTYPSATMVKTVEEYDPATDTWTRRADMPTARSAHAASVVDGKIYVIGGATGAFGPMVATVEVYDPTTDTWTTRADMPTARGLVSTCAVNGKIYAMGGGIGWAPSVATVEVYDPSTDTWSLEADMPIARAAHSATVVDNKVYVMGGTLGIEPWVASAAVEVFEPQVPLPDFNGDYVIDIQDLLILIERWGENDPACDIAPWPLGDGIVDILDLQVLMSYWGQEVQDPALVAHWKLDETDGMVAADCTGAYDGVVLGTPEWQPTDGMVGGALELDGATFVTAASALNPADSLFSVFAWIKGGAPGQTMISQANGANWLCADPVSGCLMTELKGTGRDMRTLCSETVITDGDWHRIGLVWDGNRRCLQVDDTVVAEDTQADGPAGSRGDLNIGCDRDMTAGTFFTGLIDDVRIYTRAVQP